MAVMATPFLLTLSILSTTVIRAQLPEEVTLHPVVCGSRFTDAGSSALLCDIVLQGEVISVRQSSPLAPRLYTASVNVQKVYKGQSLLQQDASFNDDGDAVEAMQVEIEKFGPDEDGESCVAKVMPDNTYVFFLSTANSTAASSSRARNLVLSNTALPRHMDQQVIRQIKKTLCEGCPTAPEIKRVQCKDCAAMPIMMKEMSKSGNKTVKAGSKLSLRCVASGSPSPMYTWIKDGHMMHSSDYQADSSQPAQTTASPVFRQGPLTIRHGKRYSLLVVKEVSPDDEGTYRCLATNAMGEAEQVVHVDVEGGRVFQRPSPTTTEPSTTEPLKVMNLPDPCNLHPCYNGGVCTADETEPLGYVCACLEHYHGNKCQFRRRPVTSASVDDNENSLQPDQNEDNDDNGLQNGEDVDQDNDDGDTITDTESQNRREQKTDTTTVDPFYARLEAKKRRLSKDKSPSETVSVEGKEGKNGAPQLKASKCADQSYCLNGGTCTVVVKLQKQFCECAPGFVGRLCERRL